MGARAAFVIGPCVKLAANEMTGSAMSMLEKITSRLALLSPRILAAWRSRPIWRRAVFSVAGLFLVIGLFGFFAAPSLLRGTLETALSEALHRPVKVAVVRVNPYALSLTVEGLTVADHGEGELLGIDRLYVNLESASLLRGGPVLRELAVEGPRLAIKRGRDGRYNVSDLIDEWLAKPASPTAAFSLNNIHISGGRLSFTDEPAGVRHDVADLALALPFISSLPYQTDIFVEPAFSATIDGAPFVLKGKSKPFAVSRESELSFDLDGFDLTRISPYLPANLPVRLVSGRIDGDVHLNFSEAGQGAATLLLSGRLSLRELALKTAAGQALLAAKQIDGEVRSVDVFGQRAELKSLLIEQADVRLARNAQGEWLGLAMPANAAKSSPVQPLGKSKSKPAPWHVQVAEARIADGKVQVRDEATGSTPAELRLEHLDLSLKHIDSKAGKAELDGKVQVNGKGALAVRGPLSLAPFGADLALEWQDLNLLPFQPYFAARLNARLTAGQLSGSGQVQLAQQAASKAGPEGLAIGFKGQATLGDLALLDSNAISLLNWKSLYFGAVDVHLAPAQGPLVSVGEVALSDFSARADIAPDGKLNLAQLLLPAKGEGSANSQAAASSPSPAATVKIGKVTLQGGRVAFTDRFIKPGYSARLTGVGGRIGELQAQAGSAADFDVRGKVDNSAPLQVAGRMNPLLSPPYLDLKASVRGFDLSPLSPYAGKFAGYGISKGKLSLDVTYHLENNQLQANNRLFLDQLTFGDRVDSPQATSLPVQLVVSLLKNRRGEIDLNLPISGSLDDPQFSLGGVIVKVIVNLLEKAVTAPFSLIASLFSGGEELSYLDYSAGRATLSPASLKRLDSIARALEDRPALRLEITGRADPEQDLEGLKHARLERKVRAQKIAERNRDGQEIAEDMVVSSDEYPALLKRAYDAEKFPKPRNLIGMAKSLPVEEMEKLMLTNIAINDLDIRNLANRRAQGVRDWLVEHGKIDGERIFLVAPKVQAAGKGDSSGLRAEFSLK